MFVLCQWDPLNITVDTPLNSKQNRRFFRKRQAKTWQYNMAVQCRARVPIKDSHAPHQS